MRVHGRLRIVDELGTEGSQPVVYLPLLGITEAFVRLLDLLEVPSDLLRGLVTCGTSLGYLVGMQLERFLLVGPSDLVGGGILLDPEEGVIVILGLVGIIFVVDKGGEHPCQNLELIFAHDGK